MVEKDQNVLVTQTVQKEKVKKETIEMQAKNSIKTLEEYCQSNSLPKPVFQKNKIKNWEVLAKVGSYEAKERGKLYTAERDAANNLLTKLKGLETKIQTEKLQKENIQIQLDIICLFQKSNLKHEKFWCEKNSTDSEKFGQNYPPKNLCHTL